MTAYAPGLRHLGDSVTTNATEVRTTSSTGGQKGVKPERYDLLPKEALDAMARVYAFGAEKYADHNWRRKYEWGKSISAAMRHMMAFQNGETNDPESGLPHPAHAMFHMAALLTWLAEDGEGADNPMDDRWPSSMARADIQQAVNTMLDKQEFPAWDGTLIGHMADESTLVVSDVARTAEAEELPDWIKQVRREYVNKKYQGLDRDLKI